MAQAEGFWFSTENDILRGDGTPDDLYTFSAAIEIERGPYTFTLREDAFTDRAAGLRFDESHLTIGRTFFAPRSWNVHLGLGLAHVGRGLLGEGTQNLVHRLIGDERVELPYLESSVHPRLELRTERLRSLGDRLDVGPALELDTVPDLRTLAAAGVQIRWEPVERVTAHLELGARWSHADSAPLEPHLDGLAAAARVALVYDERFLVSWSYNDRGDEREHVSVGYLVSPGGRRGTARDD